MYHPAWLCPIAREPIRGGWVAVEDGRIVAVGGQGEAPPSGIVRKLPGRAILPGLINAHTHLELSWLRGRVPPAASFTDWIKQLFLARGGRQEQFDDADVIDAATEGARQAREFGTAAVGDISNSLASVRALADAGLPGVVFHELLGFNTAHGGAVDATRDHRAAAAAQCGDRIRVSVAAHAPYSVSPELFRAIRAEVDAQDVPITSVHLGECVDEVDLLRNGSGAFPALLRWVGAYREGWEPPGCDPVAYLDGLGMLDARTLVVHGVQLSDGALSRLAEIGCTLVTCPRSNQWVGVGVPPIERFYQSGVRVAVGTDSLASVQDLNVFAELATMRWLAPSVSARRLLESATRDGADALGLGDELGTIEAGKRAALMTVALPAGLTGSSGANAGAGPFEGGAGLVEEFLVGGVDTRQIQWID